VTQRITIDDLDVLMLRNVPSDDYLRRPWAATAATEFGRVAMRHGVIVVNDPNGLAKENTKMYLHAGGRLAEAQVTDKDLKIAEIVRPKLVQDGMFLVGLDIVGNKLMEINVFSPGGLGSAQKFAKINFNKYVINALERKTNYMQFYGRNFDNVEMCTL
jgi:glutathione synthase/RimK-type ligase-like ATP-grasp enzyme